MSPWSANLHYLLLALALSVTARAEAPPPLAVLSNTQVTDALYETLNWYRGLGSQSATTAQAGDALILYANRQIATQVVHLALDMARADAELLSSQESQAHSVPVVGTSADALSAERAKLDTQAQQVQSELQSTQAGAGSARAQRGYASATLLELEGELAVAVNARRNVLATMAQFVNETDAKSAGANALKAQVAAIEASLPSQGSVDSPAAALTSNAPVRRPGIWDMATNSLSSSRAKSAPSTAWVAAPLASMRCFRSWPRHRLRRSRPWRRAATLSRQKLIAPTAPP